MPYLLPLALVSPSFCPAVWHLIYFFLVRWAQDIAGEQMGHMPDLKGLRWRGEREREICLGSVCLLFILGWMMLLSARCSVTLPAWLVCAALSQRVNGVSLHPTLCRSVRACLQLFTVSVDEAPVGSAVRCEGGHTYTCTHRLEGRQKKKNSLSSQSYRQGCYSNSLSYLWAEHLYSISINACTPRDETNTNMLKLLY